jgi:serine/threonine protein kinase
MQFVDGPRARSVNTEHRSGITAGVSLGRYEVISLIECGGMGEVYRAYDPRLRREVAIKILPPCVATDNRRRRFEVEALAASAFEETLGGWSWLRSRGHLVTFSTSTPHLGWSRNAV